jgi:membrane protein required for colicin V production
MWRFDANAKRQAAIRHGSTMHWLDTTLLAALTLGAGLGFISGLFWQFARIASFVLAVYATIFLHDAAVHFLSSALMRDAEPGIVKGAAYLLVFLTTYVTLFLITRLLRGWIRSTDLAPLDRLLGALLGVGKIALVLGVACWALPRWPHPAPKDWHDQSSLAPLFARGFDVMLAQVPDSYKEPVLSSFEEWRDSVAAPLPVPVPIAPPREPAERASSTRG